MRLSDFSIRNIKTTLFGGKPGNFVRKYDRHDCSFLSKMTFLDTSAQVDGIVNEISRGGAIFRPAQTYIMERSGETIGLELNGVSVSGTIVTTRDFGYAIKFFKEIPEEEVLFALDNSMIM